MKLRRLFVFMLFLAFSTALSTGLMQQVKGERNACLKKRGKLLAGVFFAATTPPCNGEGKGSGGGDGDSKR